MQRTSKRKIIAAVAAVAVCLFQACGGTAPDNPSPTPTPPDPVPPEPTPTLALSAASGTIAAEGGTVTVTVQTNQTWSVTSDADWLKASPSGGDAGEVAVTLTAAANPLATERTGVVTVKTATLTERFTVTQSGREPVEIGTIDGDLGDWDDGGNADFNKQN